VSGSSLKQEGKIEYGVHIFRLGFQGPLQSLDRICRPAQLIQQVREVVPSLRKPGISCNGLADADSASTLRPARSEQIAQIEGRRRIVRLAFGKRSVEAFGFCNIDKKATRDNPVHRPSHCQLIILILNSRTGSLEISLADVLRPRLVLLNNPCSVPQVEPHRRHKPHDFPERGFGD
jgi:hypothetical protein